MKIGIVGAGIGGLTAALACRRAGLEVHVFERSPVLQEVGAGLQLGPNAVRVLHALGLESSLAEVAFRPDAIRMRAWRSGHLLAELPLGDHALRRYGAPYVQVHRADLQSLLVKALNALDVGLLLGAECTRIETSAEQSTLGLGDGRAAHVDALVGADGIRSFVREHLFGPQDARFTGNVAFRGVVPAEVLPEGIVEPAATAWLGSRQHFITYYVRRGELINYVAVVENDDWREESWDVAADRRELSEPFRDWHPTVRRVIDASTTCHKWALYDRDPLPEWSRGRVTLLGDACHPMPPFLAQGAAMAIEDAYVLAALIKARQDDPVAALAEYADVRRPRTRRVQLESRRQGELYHVGGAFAVAARNAALTLGSRLLPAIARRRYDWLFGFDVARESSRLR